MNNPKENPSCIVAILAGGAGTRLKSRTGELPKPLTPILGVPVLEHQIRLCQKYGFDRIALLVHYGSNAIQSYFGNGSQFGVKLEYFIEKEPCGTAGALRDALHLMDERFIVLYGDTFADVNLEAFFEKHIRSDAVGTLLLHPNDHPHDSDLVQIDGNNRVVAIHPYPHPKNSTYRNLVNAALYVLDKAPVKEAIQKIGKSDLAKQTFPEMLNRGFKLQAHITPEYIKDMGTPERLDKVERDITVGLPEKLSDRKLRTAVFLDRDGTLNVEVNHLKDPNELILIGGSGEAIHSLNRAGILAIALTNQPVIARGDITWEGLERVHARLDHLLGESKAYLDGLYVCPHHPEKGFEGEVAELKINCDCRKPKTGLIDRAVKEFLVSRRYSWMIGDTTSDMEAGRKGGLRTILVRTGYAGLDGKYQGIPDYIVPDIKGAIEWILYGHASIVSQLYGVCAKAINNRLILIGGCARSGKSTVANVLKEMIYEAGRNVHVISLDGWLKPVHLRNEGRQVVERYDMQAATEVILPLMETKARHLINVPQYERKSRGFNKPISYSVGPDDVLIVEGVTALLNEDLLACATVRVFVDAPDDIRIKRLKDDYAWRGEPLKEVESRITSREIDEIPIVRASASSATHHIFSK